MNWNDIRYFLAVARHGGLTGAAKQLGVSQSTVARRVETLEAALRTRLFERLTHGYHLTEDGREMMEKAIAIEGSMAEIADDLSASAMYSHPEPSVSQPLRHWRTKSSYPIFQHYRTPTRNCNWAYRSTRPCHACRNAKRISPCDFADRNKDLTPSNVSAAYPSACMRPARTSSVIQSRGMQHPSPDIA